MREERRRRKQALLGVRLDDDGVVEAVDLAVGGRETAPYLTQKPRR
jgi:hypothetical protein